MEQTYHLIPLILLGLAVLLLLVIAAAIVTTLVVTASWEARAATSAGVAPCSYVAVRLLTLSAMFTAYRLTGDRSIFPTGRGWFWSSPGKSASTRE
jgi:hypothetical protein